MNELFPVDESPVEAPKPKKFSEGVKVSPPEKIDGVYNDMAVNKFGDIAYIPGTGPNGKLCKDCDFIRHSKNANQWGRCRKAMELRNYQHINDVSLIPLHTQSCKYFSDRPPEHKPWDGI